MRQFGIIIYFNINLMEINWFIITAIGIGIVLLVYFLIRQNKKDRKKIEKELNYTPESEETEINNDLNL
jgi:predicted membrane protein